jgi:hypothetical protein
MVEHTRAHERLSANPPEGQRLSVDRPLPRPVQLFLPAGAAPADGSPLLIHFHGSAYVAEHAGAQARRPYAVAVVNLGAGTAVYEQAFTDPGVMGQLVAAIVAAAPAGAVDTSRIVVSAFSAGHGAVRAFLRSAPPLPGLAGLVLLDGIHASYAPPGQVLAEGGVLDTTVLEPFVRLATEAAAGGTAVLITHSEIFPGTFASTTETTDLLVARLGAGRRAVLAWGPVGMQQLSELRLGRLLIRGFAGNSAPDHVDHYHGLPQFLQVLDEL